MVFFHGALGNLKAYMWSWARFAEAQGMVIICPTSANGRWAADKGAETLIWIDALIRTDTRCDAESVVVVGLSNGGTGVERWATMISERCRGLVFVSPVMTEVDTPLFVSAVGRRPILVVHGGADKQIPMSYVRERVAIMDSLGLDVTARWYAEEDHALLLSAAKQFQEDLSRWLADDVGLLRLAP